MNGTEALHPRSVGRPPDARHDQDALTEVMPPATTRTVLAGGILLLGGILGVVDAFIQGSVYYFLGVGGAALLLAGIVDGTKIRYRGPGVAMLLTFLTAQFVLKWLPKNPWGIPQLKFLALSYAALLALYGLYVLIREAGRLRSRGSPD